MADEKESYDYVKRAKDEKSLFEKITNYIPGYRGYAIQEKIRSTDKMIRDKISEILMDSSKMLTETFELMVNNDKDIIVIDRINLKLDSVNKKIAHAESGYNAFFDPMKVNEESLERLVEFDANLLDESKEIQDRSQSLKDIVLNNEDEKEVANELLVKVDDLEKLFYDRKNYMLELPV